MEQRKIPAAGEFYRHFKGNLYQIIGIARHSETEEKMVVYQALYGEYSLYVRPLQEFLSPVDRVKYPKAAQEYRFEKTVLEEKADISDRKSASEEKVNVSDWQPVPEKKTEKLTGEETESANDDSEEEVREEILRFLDAEGAEEKLGVLREIRKVLDEELITTIELSLDLLPDDKESLERRFELIEKTLEQRMRFEGGRLR